MAEGIVAMVFFFTTIMVIVGITVVSRHRERMTIFEKGLNPEDLKVLYAKSLRPSDPRTSLKWGILLVMVGAGLMLGLWLHDTYFVSEGVVPGIRAIAGGLGLVLFYYLAPKSPQA